MECFNDLFLKLREAHEREVEGWQIKVQELSNKKGCDTKRMEELFTRNQQMKEHQRLLTENIKTLENRLRAGLCDRCTVTEEFANRRQQEFEASQIQTLQRVSQMVAEITNLKKENKRLREEKEIRSLRAALESHSDRSSNSFTEVKSNSSPEFSPTSGPEALIMVASSKSNNQPPDSDTGVKTEREQRPEEVEHRQLRGMSRNHCESYKPISLSSLSSPSWRTEHSAPRVGERRAHGINGLDQRSSNAPQARNSSSSTSGLNLGRHVLHTPVPCRPQPIRGSPISFPWALSESTDWVNLATAGTNQVMQPPSKPNIPRFPNLIPTSQHANSRRQAAFGSPWPKSSSPQSTAKEPTVVFRFRNLPEHHESQIKPQEKQESQPPKPESVSSGEELQETCEGPLDLSDRGKSKSSQAPRTDSPIAFQGGDRVQMSPDKSTNPPVHMVVSSPSQVSLPSCSLTPPVKHLENHPTGDQNHKVIDDHEQQEEVNGKTEQSSEKRVPVLTISLRPVVVLETLNSALQKQESSSSNGRSSTPAAETGSSSEERDDQISASGQESSGKRKRASVETETDRDSDTDNIQQENNGSDEPQQKRLISR
ncbi:RBBP8 N-terminal-like protein isoform X1 [Solea solea]|uniref:RBBP8 N-terminal-like protein isoform X1 n=1 Tax=Solea solea TaxID=90069 RepID=UPI00272BC0B2|nr:RBBP8 N-terminal-like protein isoform X1 [Solea solea]